MKKTVKKTPYTPNRNGGDGGRLGFVPMFSPTTDDPPSYDPSPSYSDNSYSGGGGDFGGGGSSSDY